MLPGAFKRSLCVTVFSPCEAQGPLHLLSQNYCPRMNNGVTQKITGPLGMGRCEFRERVRHPSSFASLIPKPDLRNFSRESRSLCSLRCSRTLPTLFGYTPRLLKSGQIPEGWGVIPQPAPGGSKVWAPGQGFPSPSVPSKLASRIHAVGEMNHLLLWPGHSSLFM